MSFNMRIQKSLKQRPQLEYYSLYVLTSILAVEVTLQSDPQHQRTVSVRFAGSLRLLRRIAIHVWPQELRLPRT